MGKMREQIVDELELRLVPLITHTHTHTHTQTHTEPSSRTASLVPHSRPVWV